MNPVSKFTPRMRREKTTLSSNSDLSEKKDAVQVFCRLRPLKDDQESSCIKLLSPEILSLTTPPESRAPRKEVHCKFKHIFTAYANQNEVFEHVAYPLLEDLLKGKNGLLFTYGVTGSGKTYTLAGDQNNPGIMPKCIYTIFNTIGDHQAPKFVIKSDKMNGFEIQSESEAMQDKLMEIRSAPKTSRANKRNKERSYINDGIKITNGVENNLYAVFVSYIEIYNNTVFDLLDEAGGKSLQSKILREDSHKNMYVNGVTEIEVKSAEDAFEQFNAGQKRKRMGHTLLNSESSRSHSIFNIRVVQFKQVVHSPEGQPMVPDFNELKVAQLSLVDLAGSERTNRTQNTGKLLREASQINNSLMTLRTCLEILRENQLCNSNKLVPYRDSRLTLLFKNYFEGEGRVVMIVCINPSSEDFEENLQVVKFAETTQDVKIARAEPKYTPCKIKTIKKTPASATPHALKAKASSTLAGLGPKLPQIKLSFSNAEDASMALNKLALALKTRHEKFSKFYTDFTQRKEHLRERLLKMHHDNILFVADLRSYKNHLKKEKQRSANLETKLSDMEVCNNEMQAKNRELEEVIRSLQNTINEKDRKINRNVIEKEKNKQKIALVSEKMTQELDAKLRRQREHLQAQMKEKDNKLKKVKEFLEKDTTPPKIEEKENNEPTVSTLIYEPQQTPQHMPRKNLPSTASAAARQRRSRSAGEVWLEHNVVKPVPISTVFQPTMKKRKSVTKLTKASDVTNSKQSKYCLVAQEQDVDGEYETKLYKADIVPTCGGGAQVIFNDVERLRQESPTRDTNK